MNPSRFLPLVMSGLWLVGSPTFAQQPPVRLAVPSPDAIFIRQLVN